MTAQTTDFSGLLYYNPVAQGFNPVVSATAYLNNTSPIGEGDTISFNVVTWNIPDGTNLYYRYANLVNLTANRFPDYPGDTFPIVNNRGNSITAITADNTTAAGTQTFDIIFSKTFNGPAIATLTGITVVDSSQDPQVVALDLDARNYLPPTGSTITVTVTYSNIAAADGLGNSGSLFRYNGNIPTQPKAGDTFIFNSVTYTITRVFGAETYPTDPTLYAVFFGPYLAPDNTIPVSSTIDIGGPTGLSWPSGMADANRPGVFPTVPSFTPDGKYGFGNYITFNGTSTHAVVPTLQSSAFKAVTMSVWANAVNVPPGGTLMSKETAYKMRLTNNGSTVYLNTSAGWTGSGWIYNGGPSSIPVGTWHLYTVTISPTTVTTYVDGAVVDTAAAAIGTLPANTTAFMIGSYSDFITEFLNGKIGVARLYTYALSGTEVANYYNLTKSRYQTVTTITADVTGYNTGNAWLLPDISGNPDLTQVVTGWTVSGPSGYTATVTSDAYIPEGVTTNWVVPVSVGPTADGSYTFTAP